MPSSLPLTIEDLIANANKHNGDKAKRLHCIQNGVFMGSQMKLLPMKKFSKGWAGSVRTLNKGDDC